MSAAYLDWFVLTKKTVLMQRLSDLARTGHVYYLRGEIAPERCGYFAAKMHEFYQVGLTRLEQSRRRKLGMATSRLLVLHQEGHDKLIWFLLRTDGKLPPPAESERWRNVLDDRIHLTGYELVRLTRAGSKSPAWTWRYTKEQEASLRDALIRAIRNRRDDELRQLIHTLWRTPGFSGARAQVKKFKELILAEWKRSRKPSEPMPEIPKALGYVRRLPDIGRPLSELGIKRGKRRRAGARPPARREGHLSLAKP